MMTDPTQASVETLPRREALDLLQRHGFVGRVAFIVEGRPMILPVNYLAGSASLVFCTREGTKLATLGPGATIAFEVDDSHPLEHSGWSVVVEGTAAEVTDEAELTLAASWTAQVVGGARRRRTGSVSPTHTSPGVGSRKPEVNEGAGRRQWMAPRAPVGNLSG